MLWPYDEGYQGVVVLKLRKDKLKQFWMKYLFRKDQTVYYQVKVLMANKITRSMLCFFSAWKDVKFQKPYNLLGNVNFEGLLLNLLNIKPRSIKLKLWFTTFSTKHLICKTFLCLNRCLIKVKTKTLQVCLSQFCDHSQLRLIAL